MGVFHRVSFGVPRRRATAALVALVLIGLPVGARGTDIGMHKSDSAEPAEGAAMDAEAEHREFLVDSEALGPNTEELLEKILAQLRCMAFQQRFSEEPGARPGLGESGSSESELAALFEPPEVYRSGIEAERLGTLAARIVGADRSGTLDGSRATVKGLPPPLAVSGWGSPSAPLIAYVARAETPLDLVRDMSGAGVLVVDGDLNVSGSFHYVGLLVVLGELAIMEDAELSVNGLPLFAGELKVLDRGRFRVRAREADLILVRRVLAGRVPLRRLPVPKIERVGGPTDEQDCPFFASGM
jgi:hypothetical protein